MRLLNDNCPAHKVSLGNTKFCFMPSNTTPVLQPLNQDVVHALKAGYRKYLMQRLLVSLCTRREPKIDLLAAKTMLNVSRNDVKEVSRNDVKEETTQNCFYHCGLCTPGEAGASSSDNNDELLDSKKE